jgi:CubicO group peptidase (beta-lactamase class C family)
MTLSSRTVLAFVCALLLSALSLEAENDSDLVGLWRGEISRTAALSGEITIDGSKSDWSISISGQTFPLQSNNDEISSAWFSNAGQFRGRLVGSTAISAFWIQARNDIDRNEYATPIELKEVRSKVWHGTLQPLGTRLTLWMSIQRASDKGLHAVIRNPELNLFRRSVYRVDQKGDSVTFVNTNNAEDHFQGKLSRYTVPESRVIEITRPLPGLSAAIVFWSKSIGESVGFVARVQGRDRFIYSKPRVNDDGWTTASLSSVSLDEKPIAELIGKICHADPIDNQFAIHSLLVARHGKLVLEEYFYGFKGEPHTMRSASKTFAPLLIGIAREKGAKIDINTQVLSQFPEYKEFANLEPRKSKIMVRDLMTMTSGLACDDNDEDSPGNEDVMQQQTAQPDWYKYTLDLPMPRDPGGDQAVYCSAGINLLGGIVRNTAHTWLPEFFYDHVAKPLQIKTYHWNLMPNGDGYAGGGLYLRPRDQLKLGQLYLNGGVWNGKRVISKDWVERSTSRQSTFGKTLGADHDYGYGWHLYHWEVGDRSYRAYAAGGNGGQMVMVIPDLDLVVGFTGGAYGEFAKWYKWQMDLVPQFIIPAARSTSTR